MGRQKKGRRDYNCCTCCTTALMVCDDFVMAGQVPQERCTCKAGGLFAAAVAESTRARSPRWRSDGQIVMHADSKQVPSTRASRGAAVSCEFGSDWYHARCVVDVPRCHQMLLVCHRAPISIQEHARISMYRYSI